MLALAAVNGAVAVAAAAAAAHGPLASALAAQAAEFHLLHALALGLVAVAGRLPWRGLSAGLFQIGILGFSGGLYAQSWLGLKLGPLVPLGGVALILGWSLLALSALRR